MATITIAADGTGDYTGPTSAAYDALSTGSTANTVNWKPGVYTPTAGKWWGRAAKRAMTKRCTHQVSGSGYVVLDARVFVPLASSSYVTWYAAQGCWRIELYTTAGGGTLDGVTDVWFGAETGSSWSSIVIGDSYRPADSLANVGSDGLTVAGMSTGKGIWFAASESSTVDTGFTAQVIYVWCPQDDAELPAVQWGGIAACASMSGTPGAGSPRYGALCFARDTNASSNDPSGSTVGDGFILIGAGKHLIGTVANPDSDASLPVSDITYTGVQMYGAGVNGMFVGSGASGTTYTNIALTGDWLHDDARHPETYPEFTDVNNRSAVYVAERTDTVTVDGGTALVGNSHGAIEISGSGSTSDLRPQSCVFQDITITAKTGASDSRWAAVGDADNTVIARCRVRGFVTRGQFGGIGTLLHQNHISAWRVSTINTNWSITPIRIRTGGDTVPADVRVKLYGNLVDLRDSDATSVWAAFDLIANSSQDIPAGCIDARDNVALVAAGQAVFRAQSDGSGTWSTNQTWINGFTNASTQAYNGGTSQASTGSGTTLSSLFSTGTVSGLTTDTAANILTRGDTPIRRPAPEIGGAAGS